MERNWFKGTFLDIIASITGIHTEALEYFRGWSFDGLAQPGYCAAEIFSWAASRETTRVEDRAYSLMGVFDIDLPLLYGEDENAFMRRQMEILSRQNDDSIFVWDTRNEIINPCLNSVLSPSLNLFLHSGGTDPYPTNPPRSPYSMTNQGLRIESIAKRVNVVPTDLGLEQEWLVLPSCVLKDSLFGVVLRSFAGDYNEMVVSRVRFQ